MRTIISAMALLALLGQAAQAADYTIEAKPIGLLSCHLDLSTGLGECLPVDALANADRIMGLVLPDTTAQHDAHVQDWQRQVDRAKAAYIAGGSVQ